MCNIIKFTPNHKLIKIECELSISGLQFKEREVQYKIHLYEPDEFIKEQYYMFLDFCGFMTVFQKVSDLCKSFESKGSKIEHLKYYTFCKPENIEVSKENLFKAVAFDFAVKLENVYEIGKHIENEFNKRPIINSTEK